MKRAFWGDKGAPGPERDSGVARVEDVMTGEVITIGPHKTIGEVRALFAERGIHSLPVVDAAAQPLGIITSSDLVSAHDDRTLVSRCMTRNVYTVPRYSGAHIAARVMRNHRIHHVVVTHEKRVVGVVSSFDLLRLVEDKRFVRKNLPTPKRSPRSG